MRKHKNLNKQELMIRQDASMLPICWQSMEQPACLEKNRRGTAGIEYSSPRCRAF